MKKWLSMFVSLTLALSLFAGCTSTESTNSSGSTSEQSTGTAEEPVTVKMFQYKVEIAEQIMKMKDEFEKENPTIKLEIETVGGGTDYFQALKAKLAANDLPDIFNNGGYSVRDEWMDHLEDLSDQPWVGDVVDVAKIPMTKDGKLYGQPLALEGYGFIYNKDLFAKAGITDLPNTLSELEQAAVKLQNAGIQPFMNGFAEWWIIGIHNANVALAYNSDPDAMIADFNSGAKKIYDQQTYKDWVKLLDLTVKYGQRNMLTTDYNTSVNGFAKGDAAMMQNGNWTTGQILGANPNMNMGFLPMAINDNEAEMDKLPVGVPMNWAINKNSKVKEAAKTFLNWLVTSETGKRYVAKEFKFIPAFKSISADPADLGGLSMDIIKYSKEGKTITWNWFKYPGGDATSQAFANAMQAYIGGKTTGDEMLKKFQEGWDQNNKK